MNTFELKKNFHKLIDSIDNEDLLFNFYELITKHISGNNGKLWKGLSKKEQEELLLALEESNEPNNLVSHDEMKNKYKKWL